MDIVLSSCGSAHAISKIRPSPAPPKQATAKTKSAKLALPKTSQNPAQLELFASASPSLASPAAPPIASPAAAKSETRSASEAQRRAILRVNLRNDRPIDLGRIAERFKVSLAQLQAELKQLREELEAEPRSAETHG